MNSLSWMLYLADVTESVGVLLGLIAAVGIAGTSFAGFVAFAAEEPEIGKAIFKWGYSISLPAALICALIPSKTTIYAIAASEMGEEVIKSPTAGKAIKALDAWLDRQIEGEKHD